MPAVTSPFYFLPGIYRELIFIYLYVPIMRGRLLIGPGMPVLAEWDVPEDVVEINNQKIGNDGKVY